MNKQELRAIIKEELEAALSQSPVDEIFGLGKNPGSEASFLKAIENTKKKNPALADYKEKEYQNYKSKAEAGDEIAKKVISGVHKYVDANSDVKYKVDPKAGTVSQITFAATYGPGGRSKGA